VSQYADRAAAEELARELPDTYLMCRELMHSWKPRSAGWLAGERVFERVVRCSRCKTEKHQTLSSSGEVLSSHYVYPDGYLAKNLGRIVGDGRDALRLEAVNRLVGRTDTKPGGKTGAKAKKKS
jgi:hypothetical protein